MTYEAKLILPEVPEELMEIYENFLYMMCWFFDVWGRPIVVELATPQGDCKFKLSIEKVE
jgi:hypothetical protein